MTTGAAWVEQLVREVAPDEEDVAPFVIDAFLTGGKAREGVVRQDGAVYGAFGAADLMPLLPTLLQSLTAAASLMLTVLKSEDTGHILDSVKKIAELRKMHMEQRRGNNSSFENEAIGKLIDVLRSELRRSGIGAERSEHITLQVVKAMAEDPQGAKEFANAARP